MFFQAPNVTSQNNTEETDPLSDPLGDPLASLSTDTPMVICFLPHSHCSKMKMNVKKLSRFQFNFPGLLGLSPVSKQETILGPVHLLTQMHKWDYL